MSSDAGFGGLRGDRREPGQPGHGGAVLAGSERLL